MRTTSKIVLVIVLITLVYSIVKLISAATIKNNHVVDISPMEKSQNKNISAPVKPPMPKAAPAGVNNIPPTPDTPNAQGLYQADEILIDGQGKAGQNYIDITSDTPITPQPQSVNDTQSNNNSNGGGAYAQASVNINNDNNANTSVQNYAQDSAQNSTQGYAPGMPAFEVIDGN